MTLNISSEIGDNLRELRELRTQDLICKHWNTHSTSMCLTRLQGQNSSRSMALTLTLTPLPTPVLDSEIQGEPSLSWLSLIMPLSTYCVCGKSGGRILYRSS